MLGKELQQPEVEDLTATNHLKNMQDMANAPWAQAGLTKEEYAKGLSDLEAAAAKHDNDPEPLKLSKSNLSRVLKNTLYYGKIKIPQYNEEPEQLINGLHKPIIDINIFQKVQYHLGLKSRYKQKPKKFNNTLYLRGHLKCIKCGNNLTGSGSKSKTGKIHHYYHCNPRKGCNERFKIKDAHLELINLFKSLKPAEEVCELFKIVIEDYYKNSIVQGIPVDGYTQIFRNLTFNNKIRILYNYNYDYEDNHDVKYLTIYTGPLDKLLKNKFGSLEWRSLKFKKKIIKNDDYQGTSVINYPELKYKYTRIHEPKHLHPERNYNNKNTLLIEEYPTINKDEPYYPVNDNNNRILSHKYKSYLIKQKNKKIIFGGRLADYAYYDMDMTISAALKKFDSIKKNLK